MTPHFLTDVLKTLYYENERFPNLLDCMKQRGPDDRFSGAMDGKYEVAQQFGWFEEGTGPVNNCMGIICTPHPFALVIVTKNQGIYGEVMRDLSILFKDYTLTLDGDYENWSGVAADAAEPAEEQTEPETAAVAQPGEQRKPGEAALDPDDLQKLVENYAEAKGCDKKNISIGYCYLDTGDTWYYNGDVWSFGAGVYYVPMMMLLAERESAGILTRDSKIQGYPLGEAERLVLVENNNAVKNQLMGAIGTVREMRGMIRAYSSLPEEYYDPDFLDYGYMSAHFLTDVMKTLYYENERFPNILECMKERGGDDCFHGALGEDWDVAQQFGLYEEYRGNEYGSCVGVIYTPHPFVLVVMTRNLPDPLAPMGDLAILFSDYTLSLG